MKLFYIKPITNRLIGLGKKPKNKNNYENYQTYT